MDPFKCSADCQEDAMFQCADDNQYICSTHLRKAHLRHKFKAVPKEEVTLRRTLLRQFTADIAHLSTEGLKEDLQVAVQEAAKEAVRTFKSGFAEVVHVHRAQLLNLQKAFEGENAGKWPSAADALVTTLAGDYSAPLLSFGLELSQLVVTLNPPKVLRPSDRSEGEERKEVEDISSRFHEILKTGTSEVFFQEKRSEIMRELTRAWDSMNYTQLSMKGLSKGVDILALLLLLIKLSSLKNLIITRCRFSPQNSSCLMEALRRTKSEIKTMDISCSELGDEGFAEVFSAIREMRTLGLLAIRNLGLTDASIPLLKLLRTVKIDAVGNNFSGEGRNALLAVNPENKV